jgi:hypothetical protein
VGARLSGGMLSSVSASRRERPDACSVEKITTFIDTAKPFRWTYEATLRKAAIPQRTYTVLH